MSEKEEYEKLKEYLQSKTGATIWEISDYFNGSDPDYKFFQTFSPQQLDILKAIVQKTVAALDWHDKFDESHQDIREKMSNMDAKLRNHRHNINEIYSAKPEF